MLLPLVVLAVLSIGGGLLNLPFTGDEAYFLVWGQKPALGYYDHPPMVGWMLALLARVSPVSNWERISAAKASSFSGEIWACARLAAASPCTRWQRASP